MSVTRLGAYELLACLGEGGMAEVWRARVVGAAGFSRGVALKLMRPALAEDPALVQLFIDEARLSAQLRHPNIVATLDFGFQAGRYFIAMELVDGVPLRTLARGTPAFSVPLALHVCGAIAAALEHAYDAVGDDGRPLRIIHRDINPANLLVSAHGEVKLADFGIAKAAGRAAQTVAGSLRGKIRYMSPEQAWGQPLDARSDLFALGLTLYELVTGTPAFAGDEELAVLERARTADWGPMPPAVPAALRPILERALARDREARYADATAMRRALRELAETYPPEDHAARLAALVAGVRAHQAPPRLAVAPGSDLRGGHTELATAPGTEAPATPPARRSSSFFVAGALVSGALVAVGVGAALWPRAGDVPVARPTTPLPIAAAPDLAHADGPPAPTIVATQAESAPPRPEKTHGASGRGTLRIQVEPWATVLVDGHEVGMTPLAPLPVSAGPHIIEAVNPSLPRKRTSVQVTAGQSKLVHIVLGMGK